MFLELEPTVIFHPQKDIKKEISDLQDEYGDNVVALISPQIYKELHGVYPDEFKNYGTDDMIAHISITRFENEKGLIDFIVTN